MSVHDVAAYIVAKSGSLSAMKLQKLVYYSQAWHLVWDGEPLFDERIEAWANGPVVYEVFDRHRGRYTVDSWSDGDESQLNSSERATIDAVLDAYGHLTARQLSFLTHSEGPWQDARGSLPDTARSNAEITPLALAEFYGALDAAKDATPVEDVDWRSWEPGDEPPF